MVRLKVHELMTELGITAYRLCQGTDLTYPSAYRLSRAGGRFGRLHAETLDQLCRFFQVQPGRLLQWVPANGSWCSRARRGWKDQVMQERMVHASVAPPPGTWLDLDVLADVELTFENAAHPVEAALVSGDGWGWRVSQPGTQRIRLVFHRRQRLPRIPLRFDGADIERTQEFTLRWLPLAGGPSARSCANSTPSAQRARPARSRI